MSVNCGFQAGKIKNFVSGGRYEIGSKAAVLAFNIGSDWNKQILDEDI